MKYKLIIILIILCIIVFLVHSLLTINQFAFCNIMSKINPELAERIFPDSLSSTYSIYVDKIEIKEDCVFLKVGTYDSGLIIKKVNFDVQDDLLKVYVYKGLVTKKDSEFSEFRYETDMTKINRIIIVGTDETEKEIWSR